MQFVQEVLKFINEAGKTELAKTVLAYFDNKLITDANGDYGRLRVDNGNTAFFAGREFRMFYEFSSEDTANTIAAGQSHWLKFVLPVDCILRLENISVDTGAIRYRSWRGGTDSGPWTATQGPKFGVFSRNGWAQAASGYVQQSTIEYSATNTAHGADGTVSGIARIRSAGATAQRVSVGASAQQERGVPAGTYFIQLENISAGAAEGVYTLAFEERA